MRLSAGFARRAILFLSFSAARGVQMLAPVAVATLLPLAAYGAVEWAHATATLSMSVAMMGVASLIPLYLIRTADGAERRGNVRAACWHSIAVALCGLAAAGLAALALGGGHISVLVCVLIATLASHGFLTGWCRASGRMSVALYLEALPFAAMAVVAALIRWTDAHEPLSVMAASMAAVAAALLLVVLHLAKTWKDQPLDRANYRDTLRAGLPIMIGGLVAVAATLSGRFGAGALGEPETAGAFAAIARIAALCIVVHQFVIIARYHDLYALPITKLQRIGIFTNACVAVCCVALMALTLLPLQLFGPTFAQSFAANREAAVWLVAQVVVWSCTSLNEMFVLRCGRVARTVVFAAVSMAAALGLAVAALNGGAAVVDIARWHTLVLLAIFAAQVVGLGESRVFFYRYWVSVALAFLGVLAFGYLLMT
jgi:hypothetical protein